MTNLEFYQLLFIRAKYHIELNNRLDIQDSSKGIDLHIFHYAESCAAKNLFQDVALTIIASSSDLSIEQLWTDVRELDLIINPDKRGVDNE